MNNDDVYFAMLYSGDWSGDEFNEALISYLKLETGYCESDVIKYVDAVREYEICELQWICSERAFDSDFENMEIRTFIEEKTELSMLQILLLINAEEKFHTRIASAYEAVTMALAA